jgi:hypothetical protein
LITAIVAAALGGNPDLRAGVAGFHPVLDGVFHQRLQQQRRQGGAARRFVELPLHAQALAEARLLDLQIVPRQLGLLRQRGRSALLRQRMAKQLGEVFQDGLGALRLFAHQRDRGVQRVEQEMRPDARLQLGQPRRGGSRGTALHAPDQRGHQHAGQQRTRAGAAKPGPPCSSEPMSELVKRYTASVFFDKRLWQADIAGSLAHAEMLAAQGIISGAEDLADIQRGMAQITAEIESGAFEWKLDLEDVHLNIEARLTQLVGDAGKRLHTGRSRNDQVATDVRLWLRGEIDLIGGLLARSCSARWWTWPSRTWT